MRTSSRAALLGALLVTAGVAGAGCTAITDFGHFHGGGGHDGGAGNDGGGMDGGVPQDSGADAGVSPDSGADAAQDAGNDASDIDGGCPGGQIPCGGACVDPNTVDHCHGCDPCPTHPHSTPSCMATGCVDTCAVGYDDCDAAQPGCESDLTQPATCGSCTRMCGLGLVCSSGMCMSTCGGGATPCTDGSCPGTLFVDNDGDGYGVTSSAFIGCAGGVRLGGDCDDANNSRNPGKPDVCNGIDDDCDMMIDEGFACMLGSTMTCTYSGPGCTTVGTSMCTTTCSPGACIPPGETCDTVDQNCDGFADEGTIRVGSARSGYGSGTGDYHAIWRGTNGAVVWFDDSGSARTIHWASFDASGTLTMSLVVATGTTANLRPSVALGFDGTSWQVFYIQGAGSTQLMRAPITATGSLGTAVNERSGTDYFVAVAEAPTNAQFGLVVSDQTTITAGIFASGSWLRALSTGSLTSSSSFDVPTITATSGTSYAAAIADLTGQSIRSFAFTAASSGSIAAYFVGGAMETQVSLLSDPSGALFAYSSDGTSMAMRGDLAASVLGGPTVLTGGVLPQLSHDGTDTWIRYRNGPIQRLRAADVVAYPESYPLTCRELLATPGGSQRLLCFGPDSTGGSGIATPLLCP